MTDLPNLPTLADAPIVQPEIEPASHDDSDDALADTAPVEPGEEVEP